MAYDNNAFDVAEIYYKSALKTVPHSPNVLYNLADAYYKQGRYEEAVKVYKDALVATDARLPGCIWNNLGNAYYMQGNLGASAAAYKKALLEDADNEQTRRNLLFVLSQIDLKNSDLAANGKEKETKKKSNSEKNNQNTNDDSHDKSQAVKSENMKLTENNISDLFSLISQNEQAANERISKMKTKIKQLPATGPDY